MPHTLIESVIIFIAGASGAFLKDVLDDNSLQVPKYGEGKLFLGFIGGAIIGGMAGWIIDGSITTALMAGYTGSSVLASFFENKKLSNTEIAFSPEQIIRQICENEGVDAELAIRVARCESSLNTKAVNVNTGGSKDRGLFQINDKYHPEVTESQAFDPIFSAKFFCKAYKDGNIGWWNATRNCWNKETELTEKPTVV